MVWVAFALMTGAVVLAVLWPLGRARSKAVRDPDVNFYKVQIQTIERDASLGLLTPADAESAKAEAGRRLLQVSEGAGVAAPSRSAVRLASIVALVAIPAVALGVYGRVGHPDLPDMPLQGRAQAVAEERNVANALAKIEQHLAANPDDGRGWEVLAPVYMRQGRFEDAAKAFGQAVRVLGETPQRLMSQAQALVYASGDVVTPQAREIFQKVLAAQEGNPMARFYLALAREQAGDRQGALDDFMSLAKDSPPDAPWRNFVQRRIAALGGQAEAVDDGPQGEAADAVRAMPSDQQQAMIRNMVDQLATRLDQNGQDVEGWLRLVRAYTVLDQRDRAKAAVERARKALGTDGKAVERVDDLVRELGLEG